MIFKAEEQMKVRGEVIIGYTVSVLQDEKGYGDGW